MAAPPETQPLLLRDDCLATVQGDFFCAGFGLNMKNLKIERAVLSYSKLLEPVRRNAKTFVPFHQSGPGTNSTSR